MTIEQERRIRLNDSIITLVYALRHARLEDFQLQRLIDAFDSDDVERLKEFCRETLSQLTA